MRHSITRGNVDRRGPQAANAARVKPVGYK